MPHGVLCGGEAKAPRKQLADIPVAPHESVDVAREELLDVKRRVLGATEIVLMAIGEQDWAALPFVGGSLRYDIAPLLNEIDIPTLALWGDHENLIAPMVRFRLGELNKKHIAVRTIPNCRTSFENEAPNATAEAMLQFLINEPNSAWAELVAGIGTQPRSRCAKSVGVALVLDGGEILPLARRLPM